MEQILDQIPLPATEHRQTRDERTEDLTIDRAARVTKLHTYVFSATLTVPDSYKTRLSRGLNSGSKGPGGGATFDNLMNRIVFRGKPKVRTLLPSCPRSDRLPSRWVHSLLSPARCRCWT